MDTLEAPEAESPGSPQSGTPPGPELRPLSPESSDRPAGGGEVGPPSGFSPKRGQRSAQAKSTLEAKRTLLAPEGDQIAPAKTLATLTKRRIRKEGVKVTIPKELEDIANRLDLQTHRLFYSIVKCQRAGMSAPAIVESVGIEEDLVHRILSSSVYMRYYADIVSVDAATPETDALRARYIALLPEVIETQVHWMRRRGVVDGNVSLRACEQIRQGTGLFDTGKNGAAAASAIVNLHLTDEFTGRLRKAGAIEDYPS